MAMVESFATLLKRRRVEAGLSQEDLAERARVSTDEISQLERGRRRAPYKATLDLLITALALDDDARQEIEEAAALARARGSQAQRRDLFPDLPLQLTSFVDRENVVADIKRLFQSHRLVTLIGTGGAGKTRTAIKAAAEMLSAYHDGIWLAELAPISDPSLVAGVVARALRVQEALNHPILDTLLAYLKRKRLLLVVDNCEHVIDEARRVVTSILYSCPDVSVLATSRESLTIEGEQAYRMPSLPVPSASELLSAEEMSRYPAVQLFTDRALSADNGFTLTVESAPHVAEICRRLDGIPLAVELAAARVKVLSLRELAQRLDERFRVLTAGDRSAPQRHQTMRALVDWSYDLLSDDEKRLFRKLSIFADGFTLEIASTVCRDDEIDEIATLDMLSSLVDKSLVQAEPLKSGMRYRLLESMQQYGRERLTEAGEYDTVARAHAAAFLAVAEEFERAWETTPDREWWAQVGELENIRAALSWTLEARGDVLLGQRLVGALLVVWVYHAAAEGRRWVQLARDLVGADTPAPVVGALELTETVLASALSQYKAARDTGQRTLARYRAVIDPGRVVLTEAVVGQALVFLGEVEEGEALLARALSEARTLKARRVEGFVLSNLGRARNAVGDLDGGRSLFAEALTIFRAIGADRWRAMFALYLAEAEFHAGNAAEALRLADDALFTHRENNDARNVAIALRNIAAYLIALKDYSEARAFSREALVASRDRQYEIGIAWTLQHFAAIAAFRPADAKHASEDRLRAARLLGYVDARLRELESLREYTEQQEYDATILVLNDVLGAAALSKFMADGSAWDEDRAVAEAMLI